MPSEKIVNYIKNSLKEGVERKVIKDKLLKSGWEEEQIREAFEVIQENNSKNKSTSKEMTGNNNLTVILPVVLALLIAGGVLAFSFMSGPDPQEEIMQSIKNMSNLNSVSSTTDLGLVASGNEGDFDGSFSFTNRVNEKNREGEFILEGKTMIDGVGGSFKGSVLAVNEKAFVRLDQFPDLGMFLPIPDLSPLKGEYILIEDEVVEEIDDDLGGQTNGSLEAETDEFFNEIFKDDVDPEIVEEFVTDVVEMTWNKDIISVINTETEDIDGKSVNRHDLDIKLDNLPDLMIEIAEKYEDYIKDMDAEEIKEKISNNEEEFQEFKNNFEEVDFSLSILVDGDYVYEVEFLVDEVGDEMEGVDDFELVLGLEFSDFDEPLNLEEPEEYMDVEEFEQLIEEMTKEMMEDSGVDPEMTESDIGSFDESASSTASAYDTQIKSELSQIRSNAEQYYYDNDGNYLNYSSSEEWENLKENIPDCSVDILGEDSYQINIGDNGQDYVAWAPLCEDENFYCVDSQGDAGEYEDEPVNLEGVSCDEVF